MRVEKYSTEHLVCYRVKKDGKVEYQIYEKENMDRPEIIYYDMNTDMLLADDFPLMIETYKYFMEACEIIEFLYNNEKEK